MKVWLSVALAMHGGAALGAMALSVGHGGPPLGDRLGSVDVEIAIPDPKPLTPEAPTQQVTHQRAPVTRSISVVNVGHGSPTPMQPASRDIGPASTVDPAPTAPPRFTLSVTTTGNAAPRELGTASDATTTVAQPIIVASHVTTAATLVRSVNPAYPPNARDQGVEATALVEIVVDETGRVIQSRSLTHAGYGFDEAAEAALREYRFTPAKVGDRVVRVRMPWSVEFRLR